MRLPRVRFTIRRMMGVALVCAASGLLYHTLLSPHFGVTVPGRVYRRAQPEDRATMSRLIDRLHLASVLNLRGGSDVNPWYADEVRVTSERGVDFYDFPLSDTRRPQRRELLTLLDLFGRCRYPLLIHCKSGSDRTGLVCGLYRMSVCGEPPKHARSALSFAYGNVRFVPGHDHLHEPFLEYAEWLKARRLRHSPDRLREWVENEYRSTDPRKGFDPILPGPRFPSRFASGDQAGREMR